MISTLFISVLPGEVRAACLRGGRLEELLILRADRPSVLGHLYLGRVTGLDQGLQAAFVEIGLERAGLLPFSEAPGAGLTEGTSLALRVLREPGDGKGARLSARIDDPPSDLAARVKAARAPALISRGIDPLLGLLVSPRPDPIGEVVIDDSAVFAELKQAFRENQSNLSIPVRLDPDPIPLFHRAGIEAEIDALLEPRVDLPSGGSLLIEPVTTLTAIDVNAGRQDSRGGREAQALQVNLEAAEEIVRQLRLRALSGLVVIDFLALEDAAKRKRVVTSLRGALKMDREPTQVFPMARSGLVEMTRRRGQKALHEVLTRRLGIDGSGYGKDPITLAFDALHELRREIAGRPQATATLRAPPAVVAALEDPVAPAVKAIEAHLGKAIRLLADRELPADGFEIVLS